MDRLFAAFYDSVYLCPQNRRSLTALARGLTVEAGGSGLRVFASRLPHLGAEPVVEPDWQAGAWASAFFWRRAESGGAGTIEHR